MRMFYIIYEIRSSLIRITMDKHKYSKFEVTYFYYNYSSNELCISYSLIINSIYDPKIWFDDSNVVISFLFTSTTISLIKDVFSV
jgi:hypothetical protein